MDHSFLGGRRSKALDPNDKQAYVHQAFPTVRFGPNGAERMVTDAEELEALGPEWKDAPYPPAEPGDVPVCDECIRLTSENASMQARFNGAYAKLLADNDALKADNGKLQADNGKLQADNDALKNQAAAPKTAKNKTGEQPVSA